MAMVQEDQKIGRAGGQSKHQQSKITREIFPVLQMSCAACAVSVESMIKSVEGVKDAGVNLTTTKPIEETIKKFDSLVKELEKTMVK